MTKYIITAIDRDGKREIRREVDGESDILDSIYRFVSTVPPELRPELWVNIRDIECRCGKCADEKD